MKPKSNVNEAETAISPIFAYTLGLIGGDASFTDSPRTGEYRISVTDQCLEFHQRIVKPALEKLFPERVAISSMKTKKGGITYRTRLASKRVIEIYKSFGVPTSGKSFQIKTPYSILSSSKEIAREYVKGWMDAEGWVTIKRVRRPGRTYEYPRIAFHVANKQIRDDLALMMQRFGVEPSTWKYKNMHGLQIIGFEKVKRYLQEIGFNHPEKIRRAQNLPVWGQTRPTMVGTMGCDPERES
jgi:intein/homing endonuclease